METMYDRIKTLREALGLTQEELAQKVGYSSRSMINKIEKGKVDLPQSKIAEFAAALKTTTTHLFGWDIDLKEAREIPILNKVSDFGTLKDQDLMAFELVRDEIVSFGIKANDDSMNGSRIYENDIVYIGNGESVSNGDIVLVTIKPDKFLLRRVYKYRDSIVFRADNPTFKEIECQEEDAHIYGKVIYAKIMF